MGKSIRGVKTPWTAQGDSAANAAQTVTKAAEAGKKHIVTYFEVVLRGAAAAADAGVDLQEGAVSKHKTWIGSGAARGTRIPVELPDGGWELATNVAANLVIDAAGAGAITSAVMHGYTVDA